MAYIAGLKGYGNILLFWLIVFMKRKFVLPYVKELLNYCNTSSFALQRFVDKIFQFEFFVLSAN